MISWFKARKLNKDIKNNSNKGLAGLAENINNSFTIETDADSCWNNISTKLDCQSFNKECAVQPNGFNLKSVLTGPSKKIATALAVLTIIFSSLSFAAAKTAPGDFFYSYKILSNKTKLALSIGQLSKANELLRQSREKLIEAKEEETGEEKDYLFDKIDKNIAEINDITPSLSVKDHKAFVPKFNEFIKEYESFKETLKTNTYTKPEINEGNNPTEKDNESQERESKENTSSNETSSEKSQESSTSEQKPAKEQSNNKSSQTENKYQDTIDKQNPDNHQLQENNNTSPQSK